MPIAPIPEKQQYLPQPAAQRTGMALCLSGGGFRAALFHLGAVRRLNELGILSKLDTITSVSGGSILAGHLAQSIQPWPSSGQSFPGWDDRVAKPFRAFCSKNLRTWPLLQRYLFPWNWFRRGVEVEALASAYERILKIHFHQLPDRPRFAFCATDMVFGVNWVYSQRQIGDYMAGYAAPGFNLPVARAVAASSCFPPVFSPMRTMFKPDQLSGGRFPPGAEHDSLISGLRLTDGGVYDNMGLEPVWKSHAVVLVSDGGSVFPFEIDTTPLRLLKRYADIIANQAEAVRKRWLISNFKASLLQGTYWGIGSSTGSYPRSPQKSYSDSLGKEIIALVRTDLDAFSKAEIGVLENHGYFLAEAAIQSHASDLVGPNPITFKIPHPDWMDEALVRRELRRSSKRYLLGRF
jgi:NTE family protein